MQVLHVIDSSYHVLNDNKSISLLHLKDKRKHEQKQEQKQDKFIGFMERISVFIQQIGISLINIHPQVGGLVSYTLIPWSFVKLCSSGVSFVGIAFCMCKEHYSQSGTEYGSTEAFFPNRIIANR